MVNTAIIRWRYRFTIAVAVPLMLVGCGNESSEVQEFRAADATMAANPVLTQELRAAAAATLSIGHFEMAAHIDVAGEITYVDGIYGQLRHQQFTVDEDPTSPVLDTLHYYDGLRWMMGDPAQDYAITALEDGTYADVGPSIILQMLDDATAFTTGLDGGIVFSLSASTLESYLLQDAGNISGADGVAYVGASGLINSVELGYSALSGANWLPVNYSVQYSNIGNAVLPPPPPEDPSHIEPPMEQGTIESRQEYPPN